MLGHGISGWVRWSGARDRRGVSTTGFDDAAPAVPPARQVARSPERVQEVPAWFLRITASRAVAPSRPPERHEAGSDIGNRPLTCANAGGRYWV